MSATTTTTLLEPHKMSNRRQPIRQTRTTSARNATNSRTLGGAAFGAQQEQAKADTPPGFFPGVMHFTDSITALPKEMIRHYTMLKEVDAKIYQPEEALKRLVNEALKGPPPGPILPTINHASQSGFNHATTTTANALDVPDTINLDALFDLPHRQLHLELRLIANSMLGTLDEKNHVIGTATDALESHLARCESSWPTIENEISETTRLGSLDHWAYTNNSATEKKAAAEPRPRREAANSLAALANASEMDRLDGRSVLHPRKQRAQQPDSDFDESRPGKRTVTGKTKKQELTSAPAITGLGITNGTVANKKRKIEKTAPGTGGHAMDRTVSSLYGSVRGGISPRDTPAAEPAKKRNRNTGGALVAAVSGRKRAGTANSAANSPAMASSPIAGNFTSAPKVTNSPALGTAMQRQTSTRARQNSTQTPHPPKPPPTTAKETNGNSHTMAPETTVGAKSVENKTTKTEETVNNDANVKSTGRVSDRSTMKREESAASRHRPPAITTNSRSNGKASKTATPVAASFSENTRPRSGRTNNSSTLGSDAPIKRSHKKGGGIGAQQAAAAKAAAAVAEAAKKVVGPGDEITSDAGDGEEPGDGDPLYCYCQQVSYGAMVGCDGENCKNEWFHMDCAGLDKAPKPHERWFCRDCAPGSKRR